MTKITESLAKTITQLELFIKNKETEKLKILLTANQKEQNKIIHHSLNDRIGYNLLSKAIHYEYVGVIEFLLKYGFPVNGIKDVEGERLPLIQAYGKKNVDVIKLLLRYKADPRKKFKMCDVVDLTVTIDLTDIKIKIWQAILDSDLGGIADIAAKNSFQCKTIGVLLDFLKDNPKFLAPKFKLDKYFNLEQKDYIAQIKLTINSNTLEVEKKNLDTYPTLSYPIQALSNAVSGTNENIRISKAIVFAHALHDNGLYGKAIMYYAKSFEMAKNIQLTLLKYSSFMKASIGLANCHSALKNKNVKLRYNLCTSYYSQLYKLARESKTKVRKEGEPLKIA